jgi:hypothetical protein
MTKKDEKIYENEKNIVADKFASETNETAKKTTDGELSLEDMDDVAGGFICYPIPFTP